MPQLYPYQERVRSALIDRGKNVIVQAPTGTGKTRAALMPYFENLDRHAEEAYPSGAPLPLTCRYAVPMRVLAAQFEREYHDYFDRLDRRGSDLSRRYREKLGIRLPAIQTGETPEDPEFASPLTFCTIDQLLASFIGVPYSLSPRQANLNVGAVAGSYLILDEFHLYPLENGGGARTTTLAMLRLLSRFCRFVLMTATFSTALLNELATLLDADLVRVSDEELPEIMKGRSRSIGHSEEFMTPEAILTAHDAARERRAGASLVVCNTVARAQDIYLHLKQMLEARGMLQETRLELLHSRFTPEDRRAKSDTIEACLGEENWRGGRFYGPDTIIVGTQVVEVGLNISAGVLHTELAPANSIIQRAGRCARFAQQHGEVIVYPIPPRADGQVSYRPYDDASCKATWEQLGEMIGSANTLAFGCGEEQALIDAVHTGEDRRILATFAEREGRIRRAIMETLNTHNPDQTSELIRNVMSVSIVIHDAPEDAITTKPFAWESFQLHPSTLKGAWEQLNARRDEAGASWVMKQLKYLDSGKDWSEDDNDRESHYTWDPLTGQEQIKGVLCIALPPELATYDQELGFRLLTEDEQRSTGWKSSPMEQRRRRNEYALGRQGSYVEHITGLMRAYDWSVRRELAWIAARLERALGLPTERVDEAVRLAIACHDIGKLGVGWQRWAHGWQALLIEQYGKQFTVQLGRELLAKTDRLSDWQREHDLEKTLGIKRPPHACAGVLASAMLMAQRLSQQVAPERREAGLALTCAVLSAIARHHTPTATEYTAIAWDAPSTRLVIAEALAACRLATDLDLLDLSKHDAGELDKHYLLMADSDSETNRLATWLGFALVRALRLCDQRAERNW